MNFPNPPAGSDAPAIATLPPRRITVGLVGLVFSSVAVFALVTLTLFRPG